jgi:hypothetical protein
LLSSTYFHWSNIFPLYRPTASHPSPSGPSVSMTIYQCLGTHSSSILTSIIVSLYIG